MRAFRIGLFCLATSLLAACGGAEATSYSEETPSKPNADGRTYYCSGCGADVAWPPEGHAHDLTTYCKACRARVSATDHSHDMDRWCDACGRSAVWTDDVERWAVRGHLHGETEWCPVCKIDIRIDPKPESAGDPGDHHHRWTVYCPEEECKIEVLRRMMKSPAGGRVATETAEVSPDHVHGKTTFCSVCRVEAQRDPTTGRPSKNHFHFTTKFDRTCSVESGVVGHDHDATRFCAVCQAEVPIDPGVPTGTLRVGSTLVSSPDASQLGAEAHAAIMAEIAEQAKISSEIQSALEATEAKLSLPAMKLEHNHAVQVPKTKGRTGGTDKVSRFRDVEETAERHESAEDDNAAFRAQMDKIIHPPREVLVRNAIRRLEGIAVRSEEEEKELEFWRQELDESVRAE
ncbi:MAG: hypothetical protein O7H41_02090 [Planctomycetota bacterium]|nr:hypothetical protein [Planctomycetota bacterium]